MPNDDSPGLEALTGRQQEVLALMARGMTNPQIADELGISLDGAKYHVSEVITRLGVGSREQAVEVWRKEQGLGKRIRRDLTALPLNAWAVGAAAVVVLVVALLAGLALLDGDDDESEPAVNETETPPATAPATSPTSDPTGSPGPTQPAATTTPTPVVLSLNISGLFTEPQPRPIAETIQIETPQSPFPEWNGSDAVIYDIDAGEAINLGPGSVPTFNPDGTMAAFAAGDQALLGGRLMVIDLETGQVRAPGDYSVQFTIHWLDNSTVLIHEAASDNWLSIDVATGQAEPATAPDNAFFEGEPRFGYRLRGVENVGERLQRGGNSRGLYWLTTEDNRRYEFEAYWAFPQSEERIIVATAPDTTTLETNLFSVEIATGEATFLVTTFASSPNWPVSTAGTKVLWTERYCALVDEATNLLEPAGDTFLLDTETGAVLRIDAPELRVAAEFEGIHATLVAETHFRTGTFGLKAVVDIEAGRAEFVLPVATRSHTGDYRYAGMGQFPGHGGLC